jgi:hypothetical protein
LIAHTVFEGAPVRHALVAFQFGQRFELIAEIEDYRLVLLGGDAVFVAPPRSGTGVVRLLAAAGEFFVGHGPNTRA